MVSSANPTVFGQAVTFTATVQAVPPATGTPSGLVRFFSGTTQLGSTTLFGGEGTLTLSLPVGSASVTAEYVGNASFAASSGMLPAQTVDKDAATVELGSSPPTSVYGQPVHLSPSTPRG